MILSPERREQVLEARKRRTLNRLVRIFRPPPGRIGAGTYGGDPWTGCLSKREEMGLVVLNHAFNVSDLTAAAVARLAVREYNRASGATMKWVMNRI